MTVTSHHLPDLSCKWVVYVEPAAFGHHLTLWAKLIMKGFLDSNWHVIWLTSPGTLNSVPGQDLIKSLGNRLTIKIGAFPEMPETAGCGNWLLYEAKTFFCLRKELLKLQHQYKIDAVFIGWLDHFTRVFALMGPPVHNLLYCGVHMHPEAERFPNPQGNLVKRLKCKINSKISDRVYYWPQLRRIGVLLEPTLERLARTQPSGWEKVRKIHEATYDLSSRDKQACRKAIGASANDCVVVALGAITKEKGIQNLLASCQHLSNPKPWLFVIAGKYDREMEMKIQQEVKELEKRGLRFLIKNEFLEEDDMLNLAVAGDIGWLVYTGNLGSSGILFLACSAGLTILSNRHGFIAETTRRYSLGVECSNEPRQIAQTLEYLRSNPSLRVHFGENGRRLANAHMGDRLSTDALNLLEETVNNS